MGISIFSIFNMRFSSYLKQSRRAAYTYAMRSSGKAEDVPAHYSSNWQTPFSEAEADLARNLSMYPNTDREVIDAIWMSWGLTEVYVHDIAETSLGQDPMKWKDWLHSKQGLQARQRFPQEKYDELVRQSNAEAKSRQAAYAHYQITRNTRRKQTALSQKPVATTTQKQQTYSAPPLNTGVSIDPISRQTDPALYLAKSLQSLHGIRIEDNRRGGGALWVQHLVTDDEVAKQLQ